MTAIEVKTACEAYNDNHTDHDAQKELRRCVEDLAVLIMDDGKINVPRTVGAWIYCSHTGARKVASGKTADDVLQAVTGVLAASPYDGRALFEDKTPEGVDYGPLSPERRRWIAFARLTAEPIGSEQDAVDAATIPTLYMQRIGKALAELEAKPTKSAEDQRLLLDVTLRMQWTRDKAPPAAPTRAKGDTVLIGSAPWQIRGALKDQLRTSSDFDAWVLDNFRSIYDRYSPAMDRITRENILLQSVPADQLIAALRRG